jgi:hypothetical protein
MEAAMTTTYKDLPKTDLREHLMFLALLIPTFVVIAAAVVSLVVPDPSPADRGLDTLAACESCMGDYGQDGP